MAIGKKVKTGGAYYKGSTLAVSSASGDYVAYLTISSGGCAVNSIAVIPSSAGSGDTFKLEHVDGTSSGSTVLATIGEALPNMGAGIPINLDFYAQELMLTDHALKITYSNTSSIANTIFIILERGR